ncbi:MAG: aldo/keto reductase [Ignavibacteria bacterium]|jgi:2,5-diketo-D-gluconate reductase B|nr:aldo/keto reductase [Ignavibacteria bacterium]
MQKYIELRSEKIPALGYGTFRLQGNDCITGVEDALKIGYRHIDTAQAYKNEEEVGNAIKNSPLSRDEIFLTTKVTTLNFSKENFIPSVEASLKKLRTDYVDLLLLHWPSDDEVNKIALEQLALSQSKGYAKSIGVSNFTMSQMDSAISQADICCNQVEYHPYFTQEKIKVYLNKHNLMLTAYRPLADGKILSDRHIISLAQKYNRTPAQIVLRWFLEQKDVSVIPKASDEKHRRDNFNIFDFELSEEDVQDISNLNTGTRLVNPPWSPKWDD